MNPATPSPRPSWTTLREIAAQQRFVLWAFLAGLLAVPVGVGLGSALADLAVPALVVSGGLVVVSRVVMAVGVYRLERAMGSRVAVLWAIGAFVPNFIGLIVLIVVSLAATRRLKQAGVKVGLMGATLPEQPPPGYACSELSDVFS